MTTNELNELIGSTDQLNEKLAVELTIKKYKELPKYWEDLILDSGLTVSQHWPHSDNCALCKYHNFSPLCPLCTPFKDDEEKNKCNGCNKGSEWDKVTLAICKEDFEEFMKARKLMLTKLYSIQKKM